MSEWPPITDAREDLARRAVVTIYHDGEGMTAHALVDADADLPTVYFMDRGVPCAMSFFREFDAQRVAGILGHFTQVDTRDDHRIRDQFERRLTASAPGDAV